MSDQSEQVIVNWAPIFGRWSVEGEKVQYQGAVRTDGGTSFGLCISGAQLQEGSISTSVAVGKDTGGTIILGYRGSKERHFSSGVFLSKGAAYSIAEFDPASGWRTLASAGESANLVPEREYKLKVAVTGHRLNMFVDGVKVLEHVVLGPLLEGQTGLFANGPGTATFSKVVVCPVRPKVFVIMQFSDRYKQLYSKVIKPVTNEFKLDAYHVGEVFGPGVILNDIAQGIIDSHIVVAEITPVTPNVFYELGYAHALGKPTILLAEHGKELPFDVGPYRCIFYENSIGGEKEVEEALRKHLGAITRQAA